MRRRYFGRRPAVRDLPGHTTQVTVERDPEGNFWTFECSCGALEGAGSREVARDERAFHLQAIQRRAEMPVAEDLLAAEHRATGKSELGYTRRVCAECGADWPCPTFAQAAAARAEEQVS